MFNFCKKSYKQKRAEVLFMRYLRNRIKARAQVVQYKYGVNAEGVLLNRKLEEK